MPRGKPSEKGDTGLEARIRELEQRNQVLEAENDDLTERMLRTTVPNTATGTVPITTKCLQSAMKWQKRASFLEEKIESLERTVEHTTRLSALSGPHWQAGAVEGRYKTTLSCLREAEKQLGSATHPLSSSDQYSGADVTSAVNKLNDIIFQCAMSLAQRALDEKALPLPSLRAPSRLRNQQAARRQQVVDGWGEFLVRQVDPGAEPEERSTVLRSMMQSTIGEWVYHIMETWCFQSVEVDASQAIRGAVMDRYDFRISKMWLAMLHSQPDSDVIQRSGVLNDIWQLMATTGWGGSLSTLRKFTKHRFDEILELSLKIREMLVGGIRSAEFEVLYPERLTPYASGEMEIVGGVTGGGDHEVGWDEVPIDFSVGFGVAYSNGHQRVVVSKAKVFMMP